MKIRNKALAAVVASGAMLAISGAPASAAEGPQTVTSDAGTTCTLSTDATVERGLLGVLLRPVAFSGSVDCTLADPANAPTSSAGLVLASSQPLGLGQTGGQPNDPANNVAVPGGSPEEGAAYTCELRPGVDCGFSGRNESALAGSYRVIFGAGLTPPEGETWVSYSDGCQPDNGGNAVSCSSEKPVTVR